MNRAKERWGFLAECIVSKKKKSNLQKCRYSIRRFINYGLFYINPINLVDYDSNDFKCSDLDCSWFSCSCPSLSLTPFYIRYLPQRWSPKKLQGFNNTGNVCIWSSEEVMAYYCLKHQHLFENKRICELGGGMSCLAGLVVAMNISVDEILLTDGNEDSICNVSAILKVNKPLFRTSNISTQCLRWPPADDISDFVNRFDAVICADCVFFQETQQDLLNLIGRLLKPQGRAILFAPTRGETLNNFIGRVQDTFELEVSYKYDDDVWNIHSSMKGQGSAVYEEDLHYPLMITLFKR